MEMGKTKSNTALNDLIQELNTPDAGGERVVAYGLTSSPASSDLLQPVMLIPASRLHRSKRRNACGAFLGHGPLVLQDPA